MTRASNGRPSSVGRDESVLQQSRLWCRYQSRTPANMENAQTGDVESPVEFVGLRKENLDEPDHAIQFIKKVKSFPLRLLLKPHEGLVYFLLSEREESDFH